MHSGIQFWPWNPRVEDINIEDIAHHLSIVNRFHGATIYPWSVASHSVYGSRKCKYVMEFLLHDAAEAYFNDFAKPVKYHRSFKAYNAACDRLSAMIAKKYGAIYPWPDEVKTVDLRMLATERKQLMTTQPVDWHGTNGYEPYRGMILPELGFRKAKKEFLRFFNIYGGKK
jgi:uncharacterized protein